MTAPLTPDRHRKAHQLDFVFMHGWGYDATLWRKVIEILHPRSPILLEAGYFGAKVQMALPSQPFIGIGHSAGGLYLLKQNAPACRGVIMINSFSRFARCDDFPTGIATSALRRMRRALLRDPEREVSEFRNHLGDSSQVRTPLACRLDKGLVFLEESDARENARRARFPIMSLASRDDPLISHHMTNACFKHLQHLQWVDGGHLLPQTHPLECAQAIAHMCRVVSND